MNKAILMGRLTKDPEIRYSQDGKTKIGRYTLAVTRKTNIGNDNQSTDYMRCVTFKNGADFAEKYLHKGIKVCIIGKIQTGSYQNQGGDTVYTTDIVVDEHYFCEKASNNGNQNGSTRNRNGNNQNKNRNNENQNYGGGNWNNNGYQSNNGGGNWNGGGNRNNGNYNYAGERYPGNPNGYQVPDNGFMNVPNGAGEELPFH